MVFLLEGLSLTVVIGFLFAMLDRSMAQEQVSRVDVQHTELRLHLTNRLNYTRDRVKEIQFNNNIKISLLLGMHSKIAEAVNNLYPSNMGSTFYVRSPDGSYFPQPKDSHRFLAESRLPSLQNGHAAQTEVKPYVFLYFFPITQQNRITGHAVGIYDLSTDTHCSKLLESYKDLFLVYRQNQILTGLFAHQPVVASSYHIIDKLSHKQYQQASNENVAMPIGMEEFPSLFLLVDNQQYRQHRWKIMTRLLLLCIPILILTFAFSFLIIKSVTSTLDALATNALHIAQTGEHSELDTGKIRHSEFLNFTQAFNKILEEVRRRTGDLKNANENLERQSEERRQMAEALQESEAQLRSLQDNIPIGLYRRTVDGRILFANPKMVSIFGFESEQDILQANVRGLYYDPKQYDQFVEWFETDEKTRSHEQRYKRKDGTPIWGAVHMNRTVDKKSGAVYIDGAIVDITDRKIIEEAKEKLEIQLRQARKMEALGTLAGGIAHDFNNILFAIIGYCELALEDASADTKQMENIQWAIAGAQRASELVRQILTFARQTEIKTHPLELKTFVKESLKLMRATLPTSIEIRTELDADPTVLCDPTQMHQIIVNLCTNAGHAMRDTGGVLTVSLSRIDICADDKLCELGLKEGRYASLGVADTGHGMSAGTLERIFDPYYTTKNQGEGSGMGLSVVQGTVRSLNGVITANSIERKGSTFTVYFPLMDKPAYQDGDEDASEDDQDVEPFVGGNEWILFVDDEMSLITMVDRMLSKMGYCVITKSSPLEALEHFRRNPEQFDMVISDVTMPQMAGPEMVREMLKIRPGLPAILCTGYSDRIDDKEALSMGVRALIYKPLTKYELSSTIRSVLDNQPQ